MSQQSKPVTWDDVAVLTARHAQHLPETAAQHLLEHGGRLVAEALADRADLSAGTVAALITAGNVPGSDWVFSRLAQNPNLPADGQSALLDALLDRRTRLEPSLRAAWLRRFAEFVTNPACVARLVREATTGRMPKSAWSTKGDRDRPADAAAAEHCLLILSERDDAADALTAANFLPRIHTRLLRESCERADSMDDSVLLQALAAYGVNHQQQWAVHTMTTPELHRWTLPLWSSVPNRPAAVTDLMHHAILGTLSQCAATGERPSMATHSLLYRMWTHGTMPETVREQVLALLATCPLADWGSLSSWYISIAHPTLPRETPAASVWRDVPSADVLAHARDRHFKLNREELDLLWARQDLPSETAIALLECGNAIGFEHAVSLRPHDLEFAAALYTRCPGFLARVEDVDLLLRVIPTVVHNRSASAPPVVDKDVLARLGDRVHELPWTTQVTIAHGHPELAVALADQVAAHLGDPVLAQLTATVLAGTDTVTDTAPAAPTLRDALAAVTCASDLPAA